MIWVVLIVILLAGMVIYLVNQDSLSPPTTKTLSVKNDTSQFVTKPKTDLSFVKSEGTPHYIFFDLDSDDYVDPKIENPSAYDYYTRITAIAWLVTDSKGGLIENRYYNPVTDEQLVDALNLFKSDAKTAKVLIGNNMDNHILFDLKKALDQWVNSNIDHLETVCTMKIGTRFCKIYRHDSDEYKWPKFSELAEHCLEINNAYGIRNFGRVDVDAKVTAKCFFIMKHS